jgi:hypothetical protein
MAEVESVLEVTYVYIAWLRNGNLLLLMVAVKIRFSFNKNTCYFFNKFV